jgi:hypothetical protein
MLLADLELIAAPTWGEAALRACLERLRAGGPTEAAHVKVEVGWAVDDGFCLIYRSPWGRTVGLRAVASGEQFSAAYTCDPTALDFGVDIADFAVAVPLGRQADDLVVDEDGLGWWGDAPFPVGRTKRPAVPR